MNPSSHPLYPPLLSTSANLDKFVTLTISDLVAVLRKAFDGFDREGEGHIKVDMVGSILRMMGQTYNAQTLRDLMTEFDPEGKYYFVRF